ncbi:unnamed protein product [Heligmosomoides polygyrus]|uniref:Anoctamin n=1 Tax=Heligmosomoides polygyrus TaxID=6339 RepID=A0A3P8CG11_HELPZ|nr:unnamed protein product [Heligmosomoides polygyrus]
MDEATRRQDSAFDEESQQSVIADQPLKRKGLQFLRMEDTYEDSFILHEPSKEEPYFRKMKENSFVTYIELMNEIETDPRKKLSDLWKSFVRFQPLGVVRKYFGEQIAFYFAWQGTFLTMLWPATIFGIGVFVFGFVKSVRTNPATFGNCTVINYAGETSLVPCTLRSKVSQVFTTVSSWFMKSFDNELNAFFAAFMSIWGTMFYQIWRRNSTVLAYEWDCEDFSVVEPDRPEYHGTATRLEDCANCVVNAYSENHRTNSEYHNALVIKMFALQLVNNYTSLFYIAFVRPENNGFQANGLFGLGAKYKDICLPGTCGSLLALQLISHMIIKPLPKFTKDIVIPYAVRIVRLRKWYRREDQSLKDKLNESDETNVLIREWMKPTAGDFTQGEFNEKVILFGTTMMFAALFPLAPLIALIIGLIDLRVDALRLLWLNRRPVPVMASGIGIWLPILYFLQYAAVMTNAFIIAFTSDFCSNFFSDVMYCDVKNRFLIVIVFQVS